ncbi:Ku protein [Cereibacter sphaeroides]|uniref:non-homologous end joining protein Ku n=1 Tax=Cereibacter sphaeroides TaxID=1063 RepID=UPI000F52B9A7|nr:Ku protein [Cereibacter sphaeroides]AZB63055.1 Ku protein [Cereibacter sphaeroides]AZB68976.1 Ku protein [Cereibacter sphaeroides]
MAPRSYWKGYLKLSLVTCPVTLMPATSEAERVRFRTLNGKTGHPVVSRYLDAETGDVVDDEDQVKGYPRSETEHVILKEEELDAVALESARTIDIDCFVPSDEIAWIWYDRPHYLMPADPIGEEAFAVIREAMRATDRSGVARLVLGGRERAVLLMPRGEGIILWTLRYGDEVRPEEAYFGDIAAGKPEAKALTLVKRLIEERTRTWEPGMVEDPVQENLLELVRSKKPKKRARKGSAKAPKGGDNVVSIMDALRKSIEGKG